MHLPSALFTFEGKSVRLKQTVYFLLLLAALSLPLSVEWQITKTTVWNFPLELFAPLTAGMTLIGIIVCRHEFKSKFTDFAVLMFLIAAAISAAFSRMPVYSVKATLVLAVYAAAFYFSFRFLNLRREQWNFIWRVIAIAFALLMVYTLIRYFQMGIHRKHSYEMSLPFIPGHTLLVAVGFPAFLVFLNELLRKENVKLNSVFVALFVFVSAVSYSRIYWVIIPLTCFTLVFFYLKKIRIILMVATAVLIVGGAIAYRVIDEKRIRERAWEDPDDHNSLFVQIQSIFLWSKNESNIERSNRWKVAKEIFKLHPVTGSGLNTYLEVYFWYKARAKIQETNLSCNRMNAHQLYVGWLSDMGIIGFIAGTVLMASFLMQVLRLRGSAEFVPALLLFLNFFALGWIEDFTTLEKIMTVFWISLAYVLFLAGSKIQSPR